MDEFEKHGCDFKGREACEEELDEDGIDMDDAEKEHFSEIDESW